VLANVGSVATREAAFFATFASSNQRKQFPGGFRAAMATTQTGLDHHQFLHLPRLWLNLIRAHDQIFSENNKAALKRLAIKVSIAGFAIHLGMVFLSRWLSHPPLIISAVGQNYLSAIATPFSFILFYEVLTLIAALPASTTQSIANQFEVVSLIFIRDVFKDIAAASEAGWHHEHARQALPLLLDMCSGLLMFLLVAIFQYVAHKRVRPAGTAELSAGSRTFIAQKKLVAIGLSVLLLSMAVYNLGIVVVHAYRSVIAGHCITPEPNAFFYNDVFTVMIFTDVLILILSLVVSGRYEMVFRNAAFVVSIILLRFSLTEVHPYGAPLALFAMVFGILTLLVFNFHSRIRTHD
jgi:hypothetical protein